MHTTLAVLALAAAPFWEARPPESWSEEQLLLLLHDSPWTQVAVFEGRGGGVPGVRVYLASARPMRDAEEQLRLRRRKKTGTAVTTAQEALEQDYLAFLRDNPGKYIVLAVYLPNRNAMADAGEARKMEEECRLKVKRRRWGIVGHFPPTSTDPYLRLIFPRVVEPSDKEFTFELYVPAVVAPYREAVFRVKDLMYKGQPEL